MAAQSNSQQWLPGLLDVIYQDQEKKIQGQNLFPSVSFTQCFLFQKDFVNNRLKVKPMTLPDGANKMRQNGDKLMPMKTDNLCHT